MLSVPSGARPRFVWTRMPVPLMTGMMREARKRCRARRISATMASEPRGVAVLATSGGAHAAGLLRPQRLQMSPHGGDHNGCGKPRFA